MAASKIIPREFDVFLPSHKDRPDGEQYRFRCRAATVRESMAWDDAYHAIDDCKDTEDVVSQVLPPISAQLLSWEPGGDLLDSLTPSELVELFVAIQAYQRMTSRGKGGSPSPQPSGTASSVPAADPATTAGAGCQAVTLSRSSASSVVVEGAVSAGTPDTGS